MAASHQTVLSALNLTLDCASLAISLQITLYGKTINVSINAPPGSSNLVFSAINVLTVAKNAQLSINAHLASLIKL